MDILQFCNDAGLPQYIQEHNSNISKQHSNHFKFDPIFYLLCNPAIQCRNLAKHYFTIGIIYGLIAHPLQILQYYPSAIINNNCITYNNKHYLFNEFCDQFIYNVPFAQLMENSIVQVHESTLNLDNKTAVIFHIGENFPVAMQMLIELGAYIQQYNVVITYYGNLTQQFAEFVEHYLPNKLLLKTVPFGSDVQSSLIAYWYLKNRLNYNCEIIFKLHTKSNTTWRNQMLQPFTQSIQPYEDMLNSNPEIGMICNSKWLLPKDIHNTVILGIMYNSELQYSFAAGTIFICRATIFDRIFRHESCIIAACRTPFYYNNTLFFHSSPVHAIERMFGAEVTLAEQTIRGV